MKKYEPFKASHAMTSSALSELMTREITAESNLFAALSTRREAEVIAGDFDVDHS